MADQDERKTMRVTIVIPTYNERENLRPLIERIAALPTPYDVLIVDDNSPDGTGDLAEELARHPLPLPLKTRGRVRVLRRERKEGLGAAYVAGFHEALTQGAEVIVQMDADGSHDPSELLGMIEALSTRTKTNPRMDTNLRNIRDIGVHSRIRAPVDLVIGSRRVPGGRIVGWGLHRRLASWMAQVLARVLLGFRARDITSGFRVWRAAALRVALDYPPPQLPLPRGGGEKRREHLASGYAFQEELLYRAEQLGLRVAEHPITFRDRERGRSKLGIRDILGFFRSLARLWWSDRERRFAVWLGVSLVVLTSLPYLYGWLRTPPGHVYTGVHALASGDMAVYGSYIEQVRDGRWLFVDLFTSEWPQRGLLNIFWLPVGLLARVAHLPTILTFHLARVLLIIPFVLFLARFVAAFLRTPIAGFPLRTVHRIALLFLAFSSGLGPLVANAILPLSNARWRTGYDFWPMDLWVPESNTFLTLFQSPHFIASLWLLLAIILATLRFAEQRQAGSAHDTRSFASLRMTQRWGRSIFAGIAALALFQFHPFYVPTVAVLLAAWTVVESIVARRVRWDLVGHGAIVGILSAPSVLSHLWLVQTDPITSARASQNLLFTTDWWLVALSYGFLVPLAAIGIARLFRGRTIEGRLLLVWLVATIVLMYSPLTWQRRLVEGLHVVVVLIAILGLFPFLAWLRARAPKWVHRYAWGVTTATIIAIPLFGVSTVVNLVRDVVLYTIRFPQSIPRHSFYYPSDALDAMRWIRGHAPLGEATFAVGIDGHFLPMFAARQTVLGHGVETAHFVEKYETSYALSLGRLSPTEARAFLERERARFILVTDASRGLWTIDPASLPGATLAYRNGGAEMYELRP